MFTYKREIITPHAKEIEIYNSIREVGKSYSGRGVNKKLSPARMKAAFAIRNMKKWSRIIDCNFSERDYWCRFSAPFGTFDDEEKFMQHVGNWFKRIKRRAVKQGLTLKYIGFRECGKLGKNWHLHIILSKEVAKIACDCWYFPNGGINLTPLYTNGEFEKLAEYIRKDVAGEKRLMASRNLSRPVIRVTKCSRKDLNKLRRGESIEPPQGYYLSKDEQFMEVNDVTGASYYFKFRPLAFRGGDKGIF